MRFLGVDLAWRSTNPSGVVALEGLGFPLRLLEPPHSLASHREVLDWMAGHVRDHPSAVGIDAPLLGLARPGRRRPCDDEISRRFGRFHAATYSPPRYPDLRRFVRRLLDAYALSSFDPRARARRRAPVIREVYPNALQVLLFGLERRPGATILRYKRRRFRSKHAWVLQGLRPFSERCAAALASRYVAREDRAWHALVADRPAPALSGRRLKAIEDGWDALLCALAVALERLDRGTVRLYPEAGWTRGAILVPVLHEPQRT